jgi:hypothetical protein
LFPLLLAIFFKNPPDETKNILARQQLIIPMGVLKLQRSP